MSKLDVATTWTTKSGQTYVKLWLDGPYASSLEQDFIDAGLPVEHAEQWSGLSHPLVHSLVVAVEATGGFGALSAIIVAFLHRHQGKIANFTIYGNPVILKGYSKHEVEKIAKLISDGHRDEATPVRPADSARTEQVPSVEPEDKSPQP